MSKKPIIVFEGIEGSGKSYHISKISRYLSKKKIDLPINETTFIKKWIQNFDKKFFIKTKIIKFSQLKDWKVSNISIIHRKLNHFSILGVNVKTNEREINNWQQPIIKGKPMAFAGLIKTKINDTDHYLFRYLLKPGLKKSVFGCTVNSSDISSKSLIIEGESPGPSKIKKAEKLGITTLSIEEFISFYQIKI